MNARARRFFVLSACVFTLACSEGARAPIPTPAEPTPSEWATVAVKAYVDEQLAELVAAAHAIHDAAPEPDADGWSYVDDREAVDRNGAVTDPNELRANMDWIRAEYPRALIAWLGHTITRSGTDADQERARAAELEARIVPDRSGFLWIDMRLASAELAPDGVHLTRAGYQQLTDHAWSQLLHGTREEPSTPWAAILGGAVVVGVLAGLGLRALARRNDEEVET